MLVFIESMKELPAALLLRPFNFETLATHVYQFVSDEMLERGRSVPSSSCWWGWFPCCGSTVPWMVQAIERPRPASLRERKRTLSCLNIEKVSCHYNGRPVLEQLSLQVADNEIVCLLGPAAVARPRCSRRWPVCCPGPGEIRLGETLLDAPA